MSDTKACTNMGLGQPNLYKVSFQSKIKSKHRDTLLGDNAAVVNFTEAILICDPTLRFFPLEWLQLITNILSTTHRKYPKMRTATMSEPREME